MCPQVANPDSLFLRKKNGHYYMVSRQGRGRNRRECWQRISGPEKDLLEQVLANKKQLHDDIVEYPCMNPDCNNTIKMSRSQMEEFYIGYKKKYDMIAFPCCSKECQEKMLEKYGKNLQ